MIELNVKGPPLMIFCLSEASEGVEIDYQAPKSYSMPWLAECKALGAMSNYRRFKTNMRDHDFGKNIKNG